MSKYEGVQIQKSVKPYFHPGFGETVYSRSHYKQLLKKHDCVEVGDQDIRSEKHRGMTAEEIKALYHPELVRRLDRKKFFRGKRMEG